MFWSSLMAQGMSGSTLQVRVLKKVLKGQFIDSVLVVATLLVSVKGLLHSK